MKPIPIAAYRFEGGNIGSFMFVIFKTVNEQIVKTAQGTSKKENCSVTNHNLSRFL